MKTMMKQVTFNNRQRSAARLLFIVCCLLFIISSAPAMAQKKRVPAKKTPAVPLIEQAREALARYDFQQAETLLNKDIAERKRKRQSTEEPLQLMAAVQLGRSKLHATERIVIIDSLVCKKKEVLRAIYLSRESGRIDTYASTYHTRDTLGATLYENEFANKRYLAIADASAPEGTTPALRLAVSDKIGDQWSAPTLLTGLVDEDESDEDNASISFSQNYPFLLSDGITLYYAATGPESIGGYDIFVTRSDGEDGSFLKPENIGYPYNSTANDYLLAIDEFTQLGWFVSDRNQPADSVCIYIFIPNDTRQLYGDEISEEQLRERARLTSLRDTWACVIPEGAAEKTPEAYIKAARQRLANIRKGGVTKDNAPDFVFPIDDARTYTHLSDFRSPRARQKMQQWLQLSKSTTTDATMLSRLRDNYATASAAERQQMANTIQQLEATHYPQLQQLQELGKEIRNDEINHK